jgi:hypothetical protein
MKNTQTDLIITSRLLSKLFGLKPKVVFRYFNLIHKIRKDSGIKYCIKYMKTSKLHITRYISGSPLLTNSDGVSLINGFPKRLLYLKELVDTKDLMLIRGVLTLLSYTRAIVPTREEEAKISIDLNSITDEYKGKDYSIPMPFIIDFVKTIGGPRCIPTYGKASHYISGKGSPFGKATASGPYALFCIYQVHQWLINSFIKLMGETLVNVTFGNFFKTLWTNQYLMVITKFSPTLGKLAIVKDPELKRRIIAMLDYNSQVVLKPIHDIFLTILRRLPCDRTFTQDPFHNWKPKGNRFWSLDLSSATDRFPIALQEKLVSAVFDNRNFASAWREILVNREFSYGDKVVKYSVGQPMGAYSSWAVFALSHHLVVAWAAHLCGIKQFRDYILLGDDIVINNDKVAHKYIAVMTRLGVDISMHKTHISFNTYEFAKRWIKRKVEISPLPLKGILSNKTSLHVVMLQLYTYLLRVNTLYRDSCLKLISEILSNVKLKRNVYYKPSQIINRCSEFYMVLKYAFGNATDRDLRLYLLDKVKGVFPIPNEKLLPSFMKELLNLGLFSQAELAGTEIKGYFESFIKVFEKGHNYEPKILKDHPYLHGCFNRLKEIQKSLYELQNSKEFNLIEAMQCMRVDKIDEIVSLKRDTKRTVKALDALWRRSMGILNKITEKNAYSYEITGFSYGFDMKPWQTYYLTNLTKIKDELDNLRSGVYHDPNKPMKSIDDIADFWKDGIFQ